LYALPYTSIGLAQLKLGAPADALTAFDDALARAPRDEVALRGRADTLARIGRRTDAAETLDLLSDIQERDGRLADAAESAQRALDLAEQKTRRRHVRDLTKRIRLSAADAQAGEALAKALRVLEREEADAEAAAARAKAAESLEQAAAEEAAAAAAAEEAAAAAAALPDGLVLLDEAEAALDSGDTATARNRFLQASAAFELAGLLAAAVDACYVALAFAPDDANLHLALVELYLELGWDAPAADKLALLGRLTELDPAQASARSRIVGLAADHFPDDPRLRRLSA
jgi:hypothetical protein